MNKYPLIMAPAGSPESLTSALQAGAEAVYFGVGALNMRSGAAVNFAVEELPSIVRQCHASGAMAFLTLNIIVYNRELPEVEELCTRAKAAGVDAVIASDISVILCCRKHGLPVHISVQANVSNIEAVRFYAKFAEVVVLARELKLSEIKEITTQIKAENIVSPSGSLIKCELFVHGALCSSVSGKCYLSLTAYNASANRGACLQNCRRKYRITDVDSGNSLEIANGYVMSAADLCMIRFIPEIVNAGVDILKIEGRGRAADYVYTVTKVYKEGVAAFRDGTFSNDKSELWLTQLKSVFNRGFWEGGYYLGENFGVWAESGGNRSPVNKTKLGKIRKYFSRIQVAEMSIESEALSVGDKLMISGGTTGIVEFIITEIQLDQKVVASAPKGEVVTFRVPEKVRENDAVYLLTERKFGSE